VVTPQIKVTRGKHGLSKGLAWGLQLRTLALSNSGFLPSITKLAIETKTLTELDHLIDILCN
jgi:hypothetical protein